MESFLIIFACILLVFSLLPLIKNDFWVFRVFEYPRLQKLILIIIWFIIFSANLTSVGSYTQIFAVLLFANAIYLAYQIFPFTPLAKKQVQRAETIDDKNKLSILVFNIYEHNKNTSGCIELIKQTQPDIFLLLETNQFWTDAIATLDKDYPFTVKAPLENTYGMLFYSKYKLQDAEIKYLVEEGIPSVHATVLLKSGEKVQIHALHPTPPVPNENPRSTERDKELLLVANVVKQSDRPTIVIGDMNDVAWSYTTELFLKTSGLLDPRRGRGYFNTFHAKYPFMRFPLDHAFVSTHFKLIKLAKLNNHNSDHFPIFIIVQYEKTADNEQEDAVLEETQEDIDLVEEKINKV